jgi:hypothetical protein
MMESVQEYILEREWCTDTEREEEYGRRRWKRDDEAEEEI